MEIISYRLSQLPARIPEIWARIKPFRVIALQGGLGSGKTTFTRALGHYLKTSPEASSPTFSLINEYHYTDENGRDRVIFHSDWYRLRDAEEAVDTGIEELFARPEAVTIIEWPERAASLLPEDTLFLRFEVVDEQTRNVHITQTLTGER